MYITVDFLHPLCGPQDWLDFNETWYGGVQLRDIEPGLFFKAIGAQKPHWVRGAKIEGF
jgi:hypothetical protein